MNLNYFLKKVQKNWHFSPLFELCDGIFDCPHSTPNYTEIGPLIVRSQDMRSGYFKIEKAVHVSKETFMKRVRRALPQYGDIFYSREGTYFGIAAIVPANIDICLGQRMVLIRPNKNKLNHLFLFYWLNSPIFSEYLKGFHDGSVAQRLNVSTILNLPIAIPPLPEQKAIASILGALDDKIELNRQMNHTLEETAKALFKSWFVDFDPVVAKASGKKPFGMSAETAALFPDSFEESELGEIPKGWEVQYIGNLCNLISGKSYSSKELQENDECALITLKSFKRGGGYRPDGLKPYIGKYKQEQVLSVGELIIAKTDVTQNAEVIGKPAMVEPSCKSIKLIASLDVLIIRPKSNLVTKDYLYNLFQQNDYQNYILGHTNGTTVLHLS
ncbi:MAG: restriction endonuclease subunit S, partial [Spirochaetales bacterium]|nr:restriction endonuclease subunit S [Spirochaetales bacterium]